MSITGWENYGLIDFCCRQAFSWWNETTPSFFIRPTEADHKTSIAIAELIIFQRSKFQLLHKLA